MQNTPAAHYKKRLEAREIKHDKAQGHAVHALQRVFHDIMAEQAHHQKSWIKRVFSKSEVVRGLYIHGGVGRGKSMLMDLFFDCLPDDIPARRVHFHEFMIEVHDYINSRREQGTREGVDATLPLLAERLAERSRVLCFDEFHVTDIADAMILGRLFTALFGRGVIVVATSNWSPYQLYEGGLQRERFLPFIELLKVRLEVLHLDSPTDYRAKCIMQEGSYFWPLGEVAHKKMTELFGKLTDYEAPQEEVLEVKGRKIVVQAALNGVACFTFAELCERPMGAEDYLKIADVYETVFLVSVPKLGYDRRNEVKRLMNLVDALYENKTKLIVSADAPPDKLYYGKDHAYEFERTISRLKEMQSADYMQ